MGQYNLTNEQTYSNLGIDAAIASFESLYLNAEYENLNFAFHYLRPLQNMLADE